VPRRIIDFADPDRFDAGTIGEPGDRTFFLQAVQAGRVASVGLEKTQVALLADRLLVLVRELERTGLAAIDGDASGSDEVRALDEPLQEEFRVGTLLISWDAEVDRLVVEARSLEPDEAGAEGPDDEAMEVEADEEDIPDEAPFGPDVLRVRLTPAMAQRFARRAARVVAAGRPPCPFCGQPIDRTGHLCPRRNGSGYLN
jgi:uncharacterized repeat protein (TIGR03847 family)